MYGPQVLPATTTVATGATLAYTGVTTAMQAVVIASFVALATVAVTWLSRTSTSN